MNLQEVAILLKYKNVLAIYSIMGHYEILREFYCDLDNNTDSILKKD